MSYGWPDAEQECSAFNCKAAAESEFCAESHPGPPKGTLDRPCDMGPIRSFREKASEGIGLVLRVGEFIYVDPELRTESGKKRVRRLVEEVGRQVLAAQMSERPDRCFDAVTGTSLLGVVAQCD